MPTYPNNSAFPYAYEEEYGDYGRKMFKADEGLTKREYFAAIAMSGFIASYTGIDNSPYKEIAAKKAVEYADALINELNKKP